MWWLIPAAVALAALIALHCVSVQGFIRVPDMRKPSEDQIRVACVGDSITFGHGVKPWGKMQYPRQLEAFLGDGYFVRNFGYSGRTASLTGDFPYEAEALYQESLDFAPDIVILMLGTNDSKPYNWKGAEAFAADIRRLVEAYSALPSAPEVYIMLPPPAFEVDGAPVVYDIDAEIIADEIVPALRGLAEELHAPVIDLFALFADRPDLFMDGVHPNVDGASVMAQAVSEAIGRR